LVTTWNWLPIVIAGGMVTGVFYAVLALVNPIIKPTFADQTDQNALNKQIGWLTMTFSMVGFLGSIAVGAILDKTKKYKLITVVNTAIFCATYVAFTIVVSKGLLWADYILLSIIGICGTSNMNLIIQYGIELTYPQSVPVMAVLSCCSQHLFNLIVRVFR